MATFGNTGIGGYTGTYGGDTKHATKFTLTENADVSKITAYIRDAALVGGVSCKCAIYADDGGSPSRPSALKAVSSVSYAPADYAWVDFAITVSLTPGVYWLTLKPDTNLHSKYDAGSTDQFVDKGEAYDGFSDPFGTVDWNADREYSIYATYTPPAPPGGGHPQPYFVLTLP